MITKCDDQEMFDFIEAQPDHKVVNMDETSVNERWTCGCLLVQFGHYKGYYQCHAGVNTIYQGSNTVIEFDKSGQVCQLIKRLLGYPSAVRYKTIKGLVKTL